MKVVIDRVVEFANRYKLTNISTGTVLGTFDFEEVTGTVQAVGTVIDKELFDSIAEDLANRLLKNNPITSGTKCKITYDEKGLVTAGADLTVNDIPTLPQSKITNLTDNLNSKLEGVKDSSGTDLPISNKKVQLSKSAVGLGNVANKTMDTTPTDGSANYITSGGVKTELDKKQPNLNDTQKSAVNSGITATKVSSYDSHIANKNNPHEVTASQVGAYTQSETDTKLSAKQNVINNSNKLSADLLDDTNTTKKTVTQAEKNAWNSKSPALTFDESPTANSDNPVKSKGIKSALDGKQASLNQSQLNAVNSGIDSTKVAQIATNATNIGNKLNITGDNGTSAGVSALMNKLTLETSDPQDDDYYIAQYAGGGTTTTTYHRRKHSSLFKYINKKLESPNLFDYRQITSIIRNGITFTNVNDGSFRISGTPTAQAYTTLSYNLYLVAGRMYSSKLFGELPNGVSFELNHNGSRVQRISKSTFTVNETGNYQPYLSVAFPLSGQTLDLSVYPMIVEGSTIPTIFEPFKGKIINQVDTKFGPGAEFTISANSNLNDDKFWIGGQYICTANSDALTLTNCPTTYAFKMTVEYSISNYQSLTGTWTHITQTIKDLAGATWRRMRSTDGSGGVNFESWKRAVEGVKGEKEKYYRTGNVNITPNNIGAVSTTANQGLLIAEKANARANIGLKGYKQSVRFLLQGMCLPTANEAKQDGSDYNQYAYANFVFPAVIQALAPNVGILEFYMSNDSQLYSCLYTTASNPSAGAHQWTIVPLGTLGVDCYGFCLKIAHNKITQNDGIIINNNNRLIIEFGE